MRYKKEDHFMPNCIEQKDENGIIKNISNQNQITKSFNNYFTNIASELLKQRKYPVNKHFSE